MSVGCPARRYVPDRRIAPTLVARATGTAAVRCLGSIAAFGTTTTCLGTITSAGAVASFGAITRPWPIGASAIAGTITRAGAVLSSVELAIAATMVHPVCSAGPQIVVAEFLRNAGIVVTNSLAVRRVV